VVRLDCDHLLTHLEHKTVERKLYHDKTGPVSMGHEENDMSCSQHFIQIRLLHKGKRTSVSASRVVFTAAKRSVCMIISVMRIVVQLHARFPKQETACAGQ
jgi:hypothetical protein